MIDIVIPLAKGSLWENNELKYCLRSFERHLHGTNRLFLIGEYPDFIKDAIQVESVHNNDLAFFRERNIFYKILTACLNPAISDPFLLASDDHFLLQDVDAETFPVYYKGSVSEEVKNHHISQPYRRTLNNTAQALGMGVNNYGMHCPILIDKAKFLKTVPTLDWRKHYGFVIKTAYCVMNNIEGSYYPDLKFRREELTEQTFHQRIKDRLFFSTSNVVPLLIKSFLENTFPNKSKFEQ